MTHPPGYVLQVTPDAVDVGRFESLAAKGRAHADAGDHGSALASVDSALALWRGRPLVELADLDFAEREASRLEEIRLSIVELRSDIVLSLGDHDVLAATLAPLVQDHPLRERLTSQLMLALYRGGRQSEALRVYERTRVELRDQLGLDPSLALRELQASILRQDPDLDFPPPAHRPRAIAGAETGDDPPAHRTAARERPAGTVTFLFTDIEGSSGYWESDSGAMSAALARHDTLLREVIVAHGGHLFATTGDGFGAAFLRARDAVHAAIGAQLALRREAWPPSVDLRVRMGIHTGEAEERDGTYFGHPVNVAARLMAAAHGGQVVVSEVTASVMGRVPGVDLVPLGRHRFRGLIQAVGALGVTADGLTWVDRPLASQSVGAGNLRRPPTAWYGEESMVNRLAADLPLRRALTLTGTGGIGKTRLALEVAQRALREFADGVWMVELATITDADAVTIALASTFSLQLQADLEPREAVLDWLRERHLLLVLDNAEHLLREVRPLVTEIMSRCPDVTTVVTSRTPLSVAGERVIGVPMLSVRDAVSLFCDRSESLGGPSDFPASDRDLVASICQRLDGIPLAIELAAARTRSLALTDLLSRLDDRFELLTRGRHGEVEHHQTLRATVDWSYQLLSDPERALLARLSVFPNKFDLAAVEAICANEAIARPDIPDLVDALVTNSLVVADPQGGSSRYRLLETLRHYAAERLREQGDDEVFHARHLHHFLEVADRARRVCASPQQADGDAALELEWDNIRAAHTRAVMLGEAREAQTLVELTGHHAFRCYRHEHEAWTAQTLAMENGASSPSPTCQGWASFWALLAGDVDRALNLARRVIDRADPVDDPHAALCWTVTASAQLASGNGEVARGSAAHAVAAAAAGDDPFSQAWALSAAIEAALNAEPVTIQERIDDLLALAERIGAPSLLARVAYHRGQLHLATVESQDPRAARDRYADGLALAQMVGDRFMEQLSVYGVVESTTALRDPESAPVSHDALVQFYGARNWIGIWGLLNVIAEWLAFVGAVETAAIVYGHLEAHHHLPWDSPAVRRRRTDGLEAVRVHAEAQSWMARGAGMSGDQVVSYTIACLAERSPMGNG